MNDMSGEGRYKHPSNSKGKGTAAKEIGAAESTAKATAGNPPDKDTAGAISKPDPGPEAGHDATWGEMASRHSRARDDMSKRHQREMAEMHARHGDEHKKLGGEHAKELGALAAPGETKVAGEAKATAGSPKELGSQKSEGTKGSEP